MENKNQKEVAMDFKITDEIKEMDREQVLEGLLEFNTAQDGYQAPRDLGIYLENENGEKAAGLIGQTHGNWLMIRILWVGESQRERRIGSQLLKKAEETAKKRGCKYAFLDTLSFQAPEFYKKNGYEEVFELEEYPLTGKRIYFTKVI